MIKDIQKGTTIQSRHEPPIVAEVMDVYDGILSLKTSTGTEMRVPVTEVESEWDVFTPKPYRYFITYSKFTEGVWHPCRTAVARGRIISSAEDVDEIEQFICSTEPEIVPSRLMVTSWQPFELPPSVLETALAAIQLLDYVLQSNPQEPWCTADFKKTATKVIEGN